ncbi:hypothetical protein CR983_03235 [Candidatus Saccharibacteria bacterium]|nr:MAG: hypothetical protein CR983_03235 [Candidatus Saccharibacteria bacterium]
MPNRQVALLLIAALMAYAGGLFVAWDAVNPAQRQGRSAGTVITAVMCAGILAALIDLRYAQPEYACVLGTVLGAFALPATTGLVIQRLMAHGAAE